jgi:hypothetical protein
MVDGVHSNTTSLGPRVALDAVLVVSTTGLQEGLVNTTTSSNNTNGGTGSREDDLLGTGGELDAGLAIVVVSNDGGVTSGGTGKSTTITDGLLNVADNGTLGHGSQRKNVTDVQGSLLTAVNELTGVGTLSGDEGLSAHLVSVGITELDLGEGGATTGVVDNLLDEQKKREEWPYIYKQV